MNRHTRSKRAGTGIAVPENLVATHHGTQHHQEQALQQQQQGQGQASNPGGPSPEPILSAVVVNAAQRRRQQVLIYQQRLSCQGHRQGQQGQRTAGTAMKHQEGSGGGGTGVVQAIALEVDVLGPPQHASSTGACRYIGHARINFVGKYHSCMV